jgi:hypothetical protein|tara:strand:- start:70 stop:246 length:177 start_codon:yes stop_codon:yes gene_type:complete
MVHFVQLLEQIYLHHHRHHQQLLFLRVQQTMNLPQEIRFEDYQVDMGMDLMIYHQHQL